VRRARLLAGAAGAAVAVAVIGGVAPAVAVARQLGERVTAFADPAVHVTPDRVAELRFFLSSCSTGPACVAPVGLYTRGGRRLTSTVAAALLPSPGDQSEFAAVRVTMDAWRTLRRTRRLVARVVIRFPNGTSELLGYETLLPPTPGEAPYCTGVLHRMGPPCRRAPG
jgi:hypothetical protein